MELFAVRGNADKPDRADKPDKPKRILMLTTLLRLPHEPPYMNNELVDAWAADGHEVDVIVLRWDADPNDDVRRVVQDNGVRIIHHPPARWFRGSTLGNRLGKWGLSSLAVAWDTRRLARKQRFDLLFVISPCTPISALVWLFSGGATRRSYLYITDFFPYAHRDLGLIPDGIVFRVSRWLENTLFRRFDTIGCMSPRNAEYLRSHYALREEQRVRVSAIWGPTSQIDVVEPNAVRAAYGLPVDIPLLLFGGQLAEGRGVDDVMAAAQAAHDAGLRLCFVVIGAGRLRGQVEAFARSLPSHLRLLDQLPRQSYLSLAAACTLGIVATVAHTDVPTFPSRTIDYLRARLPIVASVEAATDFGDFVQSRRIGVSVIAGDGQRLLAACQQLLTDSALYLSCRLNTTRVLHDVFDVRVASRRMLDQAFGDDADGSGAFAVEGALAGPESKRPQAC